MGYQHFAPIASFNPSFIQLLGYSTQIDLAL